MFALRLSTSRLRVGAAFAAVLVGGLLPTPVLAGPDQPIPVDLGRHRFGELTPPVATVLTVPPGQVGFDNSASSSRAGGPGSFEVAPDGRVWLLDQVNQRLLSYRPSAAAPDATVPLGDAARDFAIGPQRTVYVLSADGTTLRSLTLTGTVRWTAPLAMAIDEDKLRTGPDGRVWFVGSEGTWTPVTTADGRPLPVADQRGLRQTQPLPGGGQLAVVWGAHDVTAKVLDASGQTTRSWHITSTDDVFGTSVVPAYVDGDPIVPLTVAGSGRAETVLVRLTPSGAQPPVVLSRVTVGNVANDIRVGPDGMLYQMRVSTTAGVTISRYSLGSRVAASPTDTASRSAGGTSATPATPPASAAPSGTAAAAVPPAVPGPGRHASWGPWLLIALGAVLIIVALTGALLWRWYRPDRRHRAVWLGVTSVLRRVRWWPPRGRRRSGRPDSLGRW